MTTSTDARPGVVLDEARRRFRRRFVAIVVAAGVLRILYLLVVKSHDVPVGDETYYSQQAIVIANGDGYSNPFLPGGPAANHAPLTAAVLAPVSWIDDRAVLAQRALMTLFGIAVVAGVGLLARRIAGRGAALVATAIAAVYGAFWLNDGVLMAETLATGGIVALLVAAYTYRERPTVRVAAAIGAAIAFCGLARAELLVLGGIVATVMILAVRRTHQRGLAHGVAHVAVAAGVSLAIVAPWIVRNQIRFEESTFMSTQDGLALLGTNCPPAYSGELRGFWALECVDLVDVPDGADQSVASSLYREYGLDYIGDHADELPGVIAARLGRGLSVWRVGQMAEFNETEGRPAWASWIATVQFWVLVPLAIVGLLRWRLAVPRWPLVVPIGFVVVLMALLYGIPRFRVPAEVGLVVAAAVAIDDLASRGRVRRDDRPGDAFAPILDAQLK